MLPRLIGCRPPPASLPPSLPPDALLAQALQNDAAKLRRAPAALKPKNGIVSELACALKLMNEASKRVEDLECVADMILEQMQALEEQAAEEQERLQRDAQAAAEAAAKDRRWYRVRWRGGAGGSSAAALATNLNNRAIP